MATLTELSSKQHKQLKVAPNAPINYAAKQHVLNLAAVELANAASSFPVFITRNTINGGWAFSAMTSFELNENLFIQNDKWEAVYQPVSMRTYPLYLMQAPTDEKQYTIGFNEQSDAFSNTQGAPLFDETGAATPHLSEVTKLLETELTNLRSSYEFGQTLEQLNLLKEIDVQVQYADGTNNTIKGLNTINEDVLNTLDGDKLEQLNKAGYLTPIHALLISLFHLNTLINKNNSIATKSTISAVKMEVSKEFTHN